MKKFLIGLAAILVIVLILGALTALVVPKYITNPEGALIGEYYDNKGGHDVIFVGDCEVYESFVPSRMWEKYGITSYIRGSAQQLTWQSYYILKETLKYEKPKVVVFNVLALKYGEPQNEAFNRMTLDTMKWSKEKVDAIKASMTEDERFIDYLFPLLRYHSRITQLEGYDFEYWFKSAPSVSDNGYLIKTGIKPMTKEEKPRANLMLNLPERSMEYLEKMRVLCEENGIELVLIKAPTNSWGYWWYDEWEEDVKKYAEEKGLEYYNFIPKCNEIGIDWTTDTYDEGMHLNVYGAEKMSDYFGKILTEEHSVPDRRGDSNTAKVWNEHLRIYKERKARLEEKGK